MYLNTPFEKISKAVQMKWLLTGRELPFTLLKKNPLKPGRLPLRSRATFSTSQPKSTVTHGSIKLASVNCVKPRGNRQQLLLFKSSPLWRNLSCFSGHMRGLGAALSALPQLSSQIPRLFPLHSLSLREQHHCLPWVSSCYML